MEGELWKIVMLILCQVGRRWNNKHKQYSDAYIVEVYLWAVLHDRPICWACRAENWP